jgi:hypothetical protein
MTADWLWQRANDNELWLLDKLRERGLLEEVHEEGLEVFNDWQDDRDEPGRANPAIGGWPDETEWRAAIEADAERAMIDRWRQWQVASEMARNGNVYFDEHGEVIKDGYARLAGRQGREPSEREVEMLIRDVSGFLVLKAGKGQDRCGAVPPGITAGQPVPCDRLAGHTPKIKHRNLETGFSWWA